MTIQGLFDKIQFSMTFKGLYFTKQKSMTFPGFHDPYEPYSTQNTINQNAFNHTHKTN